MTTYTFTNKHAKDSYNTAVFVEVIVENVVTVFFSDVV